MRKLLKRGGTGKPTLLQRSSSKDPVMTSGVYSQMGGAPADQTRVSPAIPDQRTRAQFISAHPEKYQALKDHGIPEPGVYDPTDQWAMDAIAMTAPIPGAQWLAKDLKATFPRMAVNPELGTKMASKKDLLWNEAPAWDGAPGTNGKVDPKFIKNKGLTFSGSSSGRVSKIPYKDVPEALDQRNYSDWINSQKTNLVHGEQQVLANTPSAQQYAQYDPGMRSRLAVSGPMKVRPGITSSETGKTPFDFSFKETSSNPLRMKQEADMREPVAPIDWYQGLSPHAYGGEAQNGFTAGTGWLGQKGGTPITDPQGQWKYPGQVTRIPGSDITMQGVNYPVLGQANTGHTQMMYPGGQYSYPGASSVTEWPLMQSGGVSDVIGGGMGDHLNVPPMQDGGCTDCNKTKDFPKDVPTQKKNEFLTWLKQTSFDKIQQEMDENPFNLSKDEQAEMKKGGNWIPKHLHKGRCTPLGKPGCPPGSPQYNLAVTFKKHHGFHQDGGEFDPKQWGRVVTSDPSFQAGGPYSTLWDFIPNTGQDNYSTQVPSGMDNRTIATGMTPGKGGDFNIGYRQDPNRPLDPAIQPGQSLHNSMGSASGMEYNWNNYISNPNPQAPKVNTQTKQLQVKHTNDWWKNPDILMAGEEAATNILNIPQRKKQERWLRQQTSSDRLFSPLSGDSMRGDYTQNNGYFRPDQNTPVQFPGASGMRQYKEGGSYRLSSTEAEDLRKQGYEIEEI